MEKKKKLMIFIPLFLAIILILSFIIFIKANQSDYTKYQRIDNGYIIYEDPANDGGRVIKDKDINIWERVKIYLNI